MSSKVLSSDTATSPLQWTYTDYETVSDPDELSLRQPAIPVNLPGQQDAVELVQRAEMLAQEVQALKARLVEERRLGQEEGRQQTAAADAGKWKNVWEQMAKSVADAAALRPRFRREVEGDAVRLALAIARKVIRRELAMDPEALQGLVRVALERVSARDVLAVRAAPADAKELTAQVAALGLPDKVKILPDPGLARGAMLLETTHGIIDASVETQLEEIGRGLTDALARNSG